MLLSDPSLHAVPSMGQVKKSRSFPFASLEGQDDNIKISNKWMDAQKVRNLYASALAQPLSISIRIDRCAVKRSLTLGWCDLHIIRDWKRRRFSHFGREYRPSEQLNPAEGSNVKFRVSNIASRLPDATSQERIPEPEKCWPSGRFHDLLLASKSATSLSPWLPTTPERKMLLFSLSINQG